MSALSPARLLMQIACGLLLLSTLSSCCCGPMGGFGGFAAERRARRFERKAARRASCLYQENQALCTELSSAQSLAAEADAQRNALASEVGSLQSTLSISEQRLANLQAERDQLQSQYKTLLAEMNPTDNPLPAGSTARFEELARKYPQFEFDPVTGVSKFGADLLFSSGSDQIKKQASGLLEEFAKIMNDRETQNFNVLVVGHTDDEAIRHPVLRDRHATNWELSTDRATQVVRALTKYGVAERRMGAAGYSKFQPVVANAGDAARAMNRRVEIFILAPDATVAGFDAGTARF